MAQSDLRLKTEHSDFLTDKIETKTEITKLWKYNCFVISLYFLLNFFELKKKSAQLWQLNRKPQLQCTNCGMKKEHTLHQK